MNINKLGTIVNFLNNLLPPQFPGDASLNGLQVESSHQLINSISFAVDSGEQVIEAAVNKHSSQLLIVHHGMFWGAPAAITGASARKIELLLTKGCSLYASHLPLDANLEVGNNAELARILGLNNIRPFLVKGTPYGVLADSDVPLTIEGLVDKSRILAGATTPYIIKAGGNNIKKVAIVTGSGSFAINEAKEQGVDLFISGEPKQEVFHQTHELKLNALFLGHYATETTGVLALKRQIEREFNLQTSFIDIPTGI